jgi:hypothetical protein
MRPKNTTLKELTLKEVSAVVQNTRVQYGERLAELEDKNKYYSVVIEDLLKVVSELKKRVIELEKPKPKLSEDNNIRVPKFDISSEYRENLITFYRENKEFITSFEKGIFAAVIKYQTASDKQINIITQTKKDMVRRKTNQSVDELFNLQ